MLVWILVPETLELTDRSADELFGLALLAERRAGIGVERSAGRELVDDLEHRVGDRDHGSSHARTTQTTPAVT